MSTDQPELSDFGGVDAAALHEETLDGVGAAYAPSESAAPSASQQQPENVCLHCGSSILPHVARVVGDNNGCVPACDDCRGDFLSDEDLKRGNFAGTVALINKLRSMKHDGIDPNGGGRY